jgi:ABC-2 type transport system ATP-binding protein
MDDIEALCNRLIVISNGKIISDGSIAHLRQKLKPERRLTIDLEDVEHNFRDPDAVLLNQEGNRLHLSFNPEKVSASELVRRLMDRYQIRDLYLENPAIEEIIAQLYKVKNEK